MEKFGNKIKKPKIRMWYDILAFDYIYGWIPVKNKPIYNYIEISDKLFI